MIVRSFLRRAPEFFLQKRLESTVGILNMDELLLLKPPLTKWTNITHEAEKIVDNPTSFINLRRLLSNEFRESALFLRKLVQNKHITQTLQKNLYKGMKNLQPWGLVVLLLSKSVQTYDTDSKIINEQQRQIMESVEMLRNAHLIHKGIINLNFNKKADKSDILCNKIAILLGDFLIGTSILMLGKVNNAVVRFLILSALRDVSESQFLGERDEQNKPFPGKPKQFNDDLDLRFDNRSFNTENILEKSRREWTSRTIYNGVSLLARGCQAAMVLAKQSKEIEKSAYNFGCHVGLAWQGAFELQALTSDSKEHFSLTSAPVLFALESNPHLYKIIEQAKNNVNHVNYEELKFNILKTDSIEKTKMLCEAHATKATSFIDNINQNEYLSVLKKLINTL